VTHTARKVDGRLVVRLMRQRDKYSADWTCLTAKTSGAHAAARVAASHMRLDALHAIERERFELEPHLARSFGLSIASMPWGDGAAAEAWIRLGRSAVETHAICGALDQTVDGPAVAEWLPKALGAGARLRVTLLEDVGHSLPYELPDVCAALVLPILRAPDDATPVGEGSAVVRRAVCSAAASPPTYP
jgi:pimeloyl-ACP methyl ester carboxylesterase